MDRSSLGDRMKRYESTCKTALMRRTPVIIRLDGKAFHTYTKQPKIKDTGAFSTLLYNVFSISTRHLVNHVQGVRLAYMQSDEVSLLITDWRNLNTESWFNNSVQKMVSVAASTLTYYFNREALYAGLDADQNPAFFDARVFNVPFEEVTNYFVWRQQDATRNSIQMLGQSYFSHRELHGKNVSNIQDMLMEQHGVNWNDVPTQFKRGHCITSKFEDDKLTFNSDWEVPVFTKDRDYIEDHLEF